ncbi:speckle-type POZ protein [Nephila pilipes]|uniref:Speckle-type POZ protein n=1 Tax=Nephila pilipes TaxID=299642 RepID=A0A8X6NLQ6_NEPPI|nr:speckle-type POZ protein [Nephila pilipes]
MPSRETKGSYSEASWAIDEIKDDLGCKTVTHLAPPYTSVMENRYDGVAEYTLEWTIENFSYAWQKTGDKLVSPVFVIHQLDNMSFTIELYPRGEEEEEYISCFLTRIIDDSDFEGEIDMKITALSKDDPTPAYEERLHFQSEHSYGLSRFLKREDIENDHQFLDLDKLTVQCRLNFKYDTDYKFIGMSFARTRILVERVSFTHIYDKNIGGEKLVLSRMSDSISMLFLRLALMPGRNLHVNLFPCDGFEPVKYYTCEVTLDDDDATSRICELSFKDWGTLPEKRFNVSLSTVDESLPTAIWDNLILRCTCELTFTTGELLQESERCSVFQRRLP